MLIYIVIAIIPYTDGFAKIPELVGRAKELGYPALALTDHGTVTGLIDFYKECKKQGIKPILGCEMYLTTEIGVKDSPTYHLLLLAKDSYGYKNLMHLDTYAHEHFYKKPRISYEALEKYCQGLICTTACIAGPLSADNFMDIDSKLRSIFHGNYYVELQPHNFKEQIEYNKKFGHGACQYIITLDSHYVTKEDIEPHKMWLNLAPDSQYYDSDDYYLMGEEEIRERLSYLQDNIVESALANVETIVDQCYVELDFNSQHYPVFCDDPMEYVRCRCEDGWSEKNMFEHPNKNEYIDQIRHEWKVLKDLDYLNYFCIIDDMIKWCKANDIPVGLGRGSVCGSTVAWMMGITQIDPIKFNLVFERFANPERVTPADIDTDVSTPCRDKLIEYIKSKYGEVYQVRTINYIKEKSAVQRAGQALGIESKKIIATSKVTEDVDDMPNGEWKDLAMKFRGHIISYGCHASALLVAPEDVCNWTAIEKQKDNMVVCHDFHQLEEQGLLKLDILGLETLDIIDKTKKRAGIDLDISKIPTDDEETAKMIRYGGALGCFQIETSSMSHIVNQMKVTSVEDLIATVALCRPGPLDSGMVDHFLDRRKGKEKVTYQHPKLEPILKDTEGIILYQEQIMQIAQTLCGYTLGEADNLRRIIGRKKIEEMGTAVNDMIKKGISNGIPEDSMKAITNDIVTFARYGFNRGHSAAYGMTAWVTAWLKCHYPCEFMASVIDANCKDKDKIAEYVLESMKMGIRVQKPSLMYKTCHCSYDEYGPIITIGLNCIKGIVNAESLPDEDMDFEEFMSGVGVKYNKRAIEGLIKAGVFNGDRDMMLQYVVWAKNKKKSKGKFKYTKSMYNDIMGQTEVLGIAIGDIFDGYDKTMVNHSSIFMVQTISIKKTKTKKGKPMLFVKTRDDKQILNFVMFNKKQNDLDVNKVYLLKTRGDIIMDFMEAKTA